MKMMYFRGEYPNFGDELNLWMWPKLFPHFFDKDEKTIFIGIGSTLGDHYPAAAKKIVFGTGFVPHYHHVPDVHKGDWDIYFVRGPRTAKTLGISPELALGDSAILLRTMVDTKQRTSEVVSFIPHWESLIRGQWEQVCKLAGMNLIDVRRPVEEVIKELLRSKYVVTEAMHGAIVADAFRIPWVPVLPLDSFHRDKWYDWAEALGMELERNRLWPSCLTEAKHAYRFRPQVANLIARADVKPLSTYLDKGMHHTAAHRLTQLAKISPRLSDDKKMNEVTEKMLEKVEQLKRDYARNP